MGHTTDLRRALKNHFIPHVLEKGFMFDQRQGSMLWAFRRITGDAVHVCEIQWEKYGRPRFLLTFGTCSPDGLTIQGQHYAPQDIYSSFIPINGSLKPGKGMSSRHWFRQDKPFLQCLFTRDRLNSPEMTVADLMGLFPEVEAYWSTGKAGPHCRLYDFSDIHRKLSEPK